MEGGKTAANSPSCIISICSSVILTDCYSGFGGVHRILTFCICLFIYLKKFPKPSCVCTQLHNCNKWWNVLHQRRQSSLFSGPLLGTPYVLQSAELCKGPTQRQTFSLTFAITSNETIRYVGWQASEAGDGVREAVTYRYGSHIKIQICLLWFLRDF